MTFLVCFCILVTLVVGCRLVLPWLLYRWGNFKR